MGELIFFAVIILFSVLESIARKRKEREAEQEGEGDTWTPAPVERQPRTERRPREPSRLPERGASTREGLEEPSETMIPADIWEEIAGLATGRPPAPREAETGTGREGAPLEVEEISDEIRGQEISPVRRYRGTRLPSTAEVHPVHSAHLEFGTDPSERTPSALDWRPDGPRNPNARRVRALLRGSGGADGLKQAVILQEVLGPPTSMKDG